MRTIWKYPLSVSVKNTVEMPVGAEVISVETVNNTVCVYAIVDTDVEEKTEHNFFVFGTGNLMPKLLKAKFLGTVQQDIYVWHIFEEIK